MFSEKKDQDILIGGLRAFYERSRNNPRKLEHLRKALRAPARLASLLGKALGKAAQATAPSVFRSLKKNGPEMLSRRHRDLEGFERRLQRSWQRPLSLLEMLIVVCSEAGDALNEQWRWEDSREASLVFEVVRRLHARACQVSSEILCLLQSGYAPAAHARWRTLHEINVTADFIARRGGDVAERYLLHEHIEAWKAAEQFQRYARKLHESRFSRAEMARLRRTRDTLEKQFEKEFRNNYGWAAAALGLKNPTFTDIEAATRIDHLRPYYKMASYAVHATIKSIRFSLALRPGQDLLLTGPSNLGLETPGHSTALSLSQVTMAMAMQRPSSDTVILVGVVDLFAREIGEAFHASAKRLKARARQATPSSR